MPGRIAALPRDERGYPVPWFVTWVDGNPVFPAADARKLIRAIQESRCWVCGDILTRRRTFVIGPMRAINRVSAEPPSHSSCAEFSAMACPFLTKPKARRQPIDLSLGPLKPAGMMIERNPGVCLLWTCTKYEIEVHDTGVLFRLQDPISVAWFCEGRTATRAEVEESIASGLPTLQKAATEDGIEAESMLARAVESGRRFLPAEVPA